MTFGERKKFLEFKIGKLCRMHVGRPNE
jgi:hypothetical protein